MSDPIANLQAKQPEPTPTVTKQTSAVSTDPPNLDLSGGEPRLGENMPSTTPIADSLGVQLPTFTETSQDRVDPGQLGVTNEQITQSVVAPGVAQQLSADATAQAASDATAGAATQGDIYPYLFAPPDFDQLSEDFATSASRQASLLPTRQQQQQTDEAVSRDMLQKLSNIQSPTSAQGGAFDWVADLLGTKRDGNREYIQTARLDPATGEYKGNFPAGLMYGLGVMQNVLVGGAIDARNVVAGLYNSAPAWVRKRNEQVLNAASLVMPGGLVAQTQAKAIASWAVSPNRLNDGKSNMVEAIRGAQYSFTDQAGTGVGINNNRGFRVGAKPGKGFGFDVNPSLVAGFGLDIIAGNKADDLLDLAKGGIRRLARKAPATTTAVAKAVATTPASLPVAPQQLELPFLPQMPSAPAKSTPAVKIPKPGKRPPKSKPQPPARQLSIPGMPYVEAVSPLRPPGKLYNGFDVKLKPGQEAAQLQLPLEGVKRTPKAKPQTTPRAKPQPPAGDQLPLPLDSLPPSPTDFRVRLGAGENSRQLDLGLGIAQVTAEGKLPTLELPAAALPDGQLPIDFAVRFPSVVDVGGSTPTPASVPRLADTVRTTAVDVTEPKVRGMPDSPRLQPVPVQQGELLPPLTTAEVPSPTQAQTLTEVYRQLLGAPNRAALAEAAEKFVDAAPHVEVVPQTIKSTSGGQSILTKAESDALRASKATAVSSSVAQAFTPNIRPGATDADILAVRAATDALDVDPEFIRRVEAAAAKRGFDIYHGSPDPTLSTFDFTRKSEPGRNKLGDGVYFSRAEATAADYAGAAGKVVGRPQGTLQTFDYYHEFQSYLAQNGLKLDDAAKHFIDQGFDGVEILNSTKGNGFIKQVVLYRDTLAETIVDIPQALAKAVDDIPQVVANTPEAQALANVANESLKAQLINRVAAAADLASTQALQALDNTEDIGRRFLSEPPPDVLRATPPLRLAFPTLDDLPTDLFHGTRVDDLRLSQADPFVGGARNELGVGLYLTTDIEVARLAALADSAINLPPVDGRSIGAPKLIRTVSEAEVIADALVPTQSYTDLAAAMGAPYGLGTSFGTEPLSLVQVYDIAARQLSEPANLAFQRHMSGALGGAGLDGVKAGSTLVLFDSRTVRDGVTELLGGDDSLARSLAARTKLEASAVAQTGSDFSRAAAADALARETTQTVEDLQPVIDAQVQAVTKAVDQSGLLEDLPPSETNADVLLSALNSLRATVRSAPDSVDLTPYRKQIGELMEAISIDAELDDKLNYVKSLTDESEILAGLDELEADNKRLAELLARVVPQPITLVEPPRQTLPDLVDRYQQLQAIGKARTPAQRAEMFALKAIADLSEDYDLALKAGNLDRATAIKAKLDDLTLKTPCGL